MPTKEETLVRHESKALDLLASRLLFEGGKPNASLFWDAEKEELRVKFHDDKGHYAFRKSTETWHILLPPKKRV